MNQIKYSKTGLGFGTACLGLLAGCAGYVDGPRAGVYAPAPSVYVETGIAVQDDYVYYPDYQVYYSSGRRQYVYLDGGSWVSRAAPPGVSVDLLFASPSVKVDFHDSPANHNAEIVKQYPKHWAQAESNRANPENNRNGDNAKPDAGRAAVAKEAAEQNITRQPVRQERPAQQDKKAQRPAREKRGANEKNNGNQAEKEHESEP